MPSAAAAPVLSLPVRRRYTVRARAHTDEACVVFCPRQGGSVPIDDCAHCRVELDDSGAPAVVVCAGETAAALQKAMAGWVDARTTPVWGAMHNHVVCAAPELDVEVLADLLLETNISGAPVVDDDGRSIGVVSRTDVLRAARRGELTPGADAYASPDGAHPGFDPEYEAPNGAPASGQVVPVRDIMTAFTLTVPETASLAHAASLMDYEALHRLPVVDEARRVVGILSPLDIVRWVAQHSRANG